MFKKLGAAALITLAVASNAQAGEVGAYGGIAADAVSTGLALAAPGIVEANPLGWVTIPIRLAMMQYAKSLPREEGQPVMDTVSAGGWGAAMNNLAVLAGAGAAAPVLGIVVGYAVWKSGEKERDFWTTCAVNKLVEPDVECRFKPRDSEEMTRLALDLGAHRQLVAQAATAAPMIGAQ